MKIIHIYGHGYGGLFVANQVISLQERGHDVSVITSADGPFVEHVRRSGIRVDVIPFGGSNLASIPRIAGATLDLVRTLRSEKPSIVHLHLVKAIVVGRIAAQIAGVPGIISQLGGPLPLEIAHFRWLDLSTAWIDETIVASSEAIARIYRRYPHTRGKVEVIYYGFDPSPFLRPIDGTRFRQNMGIAHDAPVVGMVAHMYPSNLRRFSKIGLKGHEVFIAAARLLAQKIPRAKMLIVGDDILPGGVYRNRLEQMVRNLGMSDRIIFAGHVEDVPEAIAAMDVVAVPSLSENLGGAVEPLLMQKPVVASNVGGLPELVIEGKSGRLVPPKDPAALADAILGILALSPAERLELGSYGRAETLRLFELQQTIDKLERTYLRALSK